MRKLWLNACNKFICCIYLSWYTFWSSRLKWKQRGKKRSRSCLNKSKVFFLAWFLLNRKNASNYNGLVPTEIMPTTWCRCLHVCFFDRLLIPMHEFKFYMNLWSILRKRQIIFHFISIQQQKIERHLKIFIFQHQIFCFESFVAFYFSIWSSKMLNR